MKFILPPLLPVILAYTAAAIMSPAVTFCHKKLGADMRPVSLVLTVLFLALLCAVTYFAGEKLITEGEEFISRLGESLPDTLERARAALSDKFPFAGKIKLGDGGIADSVITEGTKKLTAFLADAVGYAASYLPSFVIAFGVFVIFLFYLALDGDGVNRSLFSLLPERYRDRAASFFSRLAPALREYVRAYALIMLITFAELYLGFTVAGIGYALLLSFIIALVDFLPLLGVGTVLLPWAGCAYLTGNYGRGTALLVIYGVVTVVRQFAEPHVVGGFIGTHPAVALAGVYVGLRLFGVTGMIAFPIFLYLIRVFTESGGGGKISENIRK